MCGLCGIVGRPVSSGAVRVACDRLAHRGPDGEGIWQTEHVTLAHRRLAIIDLSADGAQPMATADGRLHVVFNGEIYNHRALRRELEGAATFRSRSDTEVLLHGYRAWGIDGLLARIDGMFAFALWDADAQELHLARDRAGKKPLFLAQDGRALAFASTLPSLLALRTAVPVVSADAVAAFLSYGCVPGSTSAVEGVTKLPPGHRATWRDGTVELRRYWALRAEPEVGVTDEEWLERIDAALHAAVVRRLESDVPLALFLSGGIDSSLVAAHLAREVPGALALTARFDEAEFDEGDRAVAVAAHLGLRLRELRVRPDLAADLPKLAWAAGEPFADAAALPTMLLARAAREHATVVLTGDGGDEGFAGYQGVRIAWLAERWRGLLPAPLRAATAAALGRGIGRRAPRPLRVARRIALAGRGRDGLAWEYDALGERSLRGRLARVAGPALRACPALHDPDAYWRAAHAATVGASPIDRVLLTEFGTLLPDQFLVKADIATMACGVEGRSPFLDHHLLELAMRIPIGQRAPNGRPKALLRRLAARVIPPDVARLPKHGFAVPIGRWLRGPLRPALGLLEAESAAVQRGLLDQAGVRQLVAEHAAGRAEHGGALWSLLLLELWLRVVMDGTLGAADRLPGVPPA